MPRKQGPTLTALPAMDSMSAMRDSAVRRNQASQDSMSVLASVRLSTDTVVHSVRPIDPSASVVMPSQQPLTRAQIMGDSIARERADRLVGQNMAAASGDTARGVVQMDGSGPGSRPVLLINKGKTTIALTGLGTDGMSQVLGSDVVVRGMRVSQRDIIVSGFSVRAVNGIPTIDGRLMKIGGVWHIELSDRSGYRKLTSVPEALQAFEGGRVWIADEGTKGVPQLYGVIARR